MILYVNGDSNSAGTELDDFNHSWPAVMAQTLKYDLANQSKPGASNPRILRLTNEYLDQGNLPNLIIIGWTSWEREEWEYQGQRFDVNASGLENVPSELQERYEQWVIEARKDSQSNKSRETHKEIIKLHIRLRENKVPHLFFNALMPFQHEVLLEDDHRYSWGSNFYGPYDNDSSYYWHLKAKGFVPTKMNHYREDAQAYWAELILKHLREHKLV